MALVVIRSRADADIPACVELLALVHERDRYPFLWPADPVRFLTSSREIGGWVAEVDAALVGHVSLHGPPIAPWFELATAATGLVEQDLAVVSRLFVSPLVRRAGVAVALLDHAVAAAHARGARPVLDVGADLTSAVALYESAGWTRLGDTVYEFGGASLDAHVYVGPAPAPGA